MRWTRNLLLVGSMLLPCGPLLDAAEPETSSSAEPNLSPDVRELLRSEMREVAAGVQTIAAALPIGGWESVHDTARRIHDSYIMNRALTDAQARELEQALPAQFVALDQALHARALKLAEAAHQHDAEQAAFHFSRMLETCVACHAQFAHGRFPGLEAVEAVEHRH
ncbi:MAG TPA: hypothetical protein VF210_14925 [Pseudomonadales bacterium]